MSLASLLLALAPEAAAPADPAYLLGLAEGCTERFLTLQDAALYARGNLQRVEAGPVRPGRPGRDDRTEGLLRDWDAFYASGWVDAVRDLALDLESCDPCEAREALARLCADLVGLEEGARRELAHLASPGEAPPAPAPPLPSLLHDFRRRLAAIRRDLGAEERDLRPTALARPETGPGPGGGFESSAGGFALEIPETWEASTLGVEPRRRLRLQSPTGGPPLVVMVVVVRYASVDSPEALYRRLEHDAHEGWEGYRRLGGSPLEHPAWVGGYTLDFTTPGVGSPMYLSAQYVHGADPGRAVGLVAGGPADALSHWGAVLRELLASLRPRS